jgi:lipid A 3-O-deacylase
MPSKKIKTAIFIQFFLCAFHIGKAQQAVLSLGFENDILNLSHQTDRYFTNGFNIQYYHQSFSQSFLNKILVKGNQKNLRMTGFSAEQKIYTPKDLHTSELQNFDRPYASTFLVSINQISVSDVHNYRITSSAGIGVLGTYAGGEFFQNFIHSLTVNSENVNGWNHQIKNDLLLDYQIKFEKGLINTNFLQFNLAGKTQLGTLQNSLSPEVFLAVGTLNDYFKNVFGRPSKRNFSVFVYASAGTDLLLYDATLQGGVFNQQNEHIVSRSELNRIRLNQSIGIRIDYRRIRLETGRIWQANEFKTAENHAWGFVKTTWFF